MIESNQNKIIGEINCLIEANEQFLFEENTKDKKIIEEKIKTEGKNISVENIQECYKELKKAIKNFNTSTQNKILGLRETFV